MNSTVATPAAAKVIVALSVNVPAMYAVVIEHVIVAVLAVLLKMVITKSMVMRIRSLSTARPMTSLSQTSMTSLVVSCHPRKPRK